MREKIEYTKNKLEVLKKFEEGNIRNDHFDGVHSIYRMAALVKATDYNDISFDYLVVALKNLPIIPSEIFLNDSSTEIVWYKKTNVVAKSIEDYKALWIDFTDYIDSIKVEGFEASINIGVFHDRPLSINADNTEPTTKVDFSVETFGSTNREIAVYDYRSSKRMKKARKKSVIADLFGVSYSQDYVD